MSDAPAAVPRPAAPSLGLRAPVIATAVVTAVAVIVGVGVAGSKGAVGAALGGVIVLAFFTAGQVVLARVLRSSPELAQSAALVLYLAKIGVLLVLLILLKDVTWFDSRVFAFTIVAATVVWLAAQTSAAIRTKTPAVVPGSGPDSSGSTNSVGGEAKADADNSPGSVS